MKLLRNTFSREPFYGFDITDDEVGPGEFRSLASELKHQFESIAMDQDENNGEVFFVREVESATRRLMVDPCRASMIELLKISPILIDNVCIACATSPSACQELLNSGRTSRLKNTGAREARILAKLAELSPVLIEPKPGYRLKPSGVHSLLRMGIRVELERKFRPYFPVDAELLSAAIIKSVLVEDACEPELANYAKENDCLINQLAHNIHLDLSLAHSFSILLSFTFVQMGPKYPEKSSMMLDRAVDLHLILRSTYEMVSSHDHQEWLDGVQLIAQKLLSEELTESLPKERI